MAVALPGARVLVTGGSGMIGSHVVDRLLAEGAGQVVVVDRVIQEQNLALARASGRVQVVAADVRDTATMRELVAGTDAIVHLAALLMLPSRQNPRTALEVNVVATHDLLQLAVELGVKRFVFGSSVSVYGSQPEDQITAEDAPLLGRTFYGASKVTIEMYCRAFADQYGLNYIALRFSSIYGSRLHDYGFFPRFLLSILDQVDRGVVPEVDGEPGEVHDFLYVGDAAEAVARAIAAEAQDVAVNAVAGVSYPLEEIFGTLLDVYGAPQPIRWKHRDVTYVKRRCFNGALAEQLLGFRARTPLADGLRAFVEWRRGLPMTVQAGRP